MTERAKKSDNPILGIILILVAFFVFSFIAASGKWLIISGIPPMQMVFMRYFGHFLISFAKISRNNVKTSKFRTEN